MIAARIGIKYGNPDESNQFFHFITAKDIPAMVILTVALIQSSLQSVFQR
jgi:hypothetical protein